MSLKCASTLLTLSLLPAQALLAETRANLNGQFVVAGAMTESPCMIDMASDFQEIALGPLSSASLQKPGDQGQEVEFTFKLRHCIVSGTRLQNGESDVASLGRDLPVMRMEFVSVMDPVNHELVQLRGIKGVGLRLKDSRSRSVQLGQLTPPQFLNSGQNILKYTAVVERTSENLVAGPFQATVDFKIHYY